MKRYSTVITVLLVSAFILLGCEKDATGPEEDEFGSLSGTVNFIGTWPTNGEIQISVYSSFPPAGPPDYFTEPLTETSSYSYKIEGITKGNYPAVVVGWRDPADPTGAKLIGFYFQDPENVAVDANGNPTVNPLSLTIASGSMHHENINIKANLDVAP